MMNNLQTNATPFLFCIFWCILWQGQAFVVPAVQYCQHSTFFLKPVPGATISITTDKTLALAAKKKRRRRKDAQEKVGSSSGSDDDELPDFDLDSLDAEGTSGQKSSKPSSTNSLVDVGSVEITDLMMGDPNMAVRSVNELISDRSLETKFEFDEPGDASIPDFTQLAQASPSSSSADTLPGGPMGTKKRRQAERRANAIKAKEAEEQSSFLSNIGFIKNEKGEVSPIKILEAGAWLGIFLLVAWELYLNSPFFDRAAPMAPVVYELLM